VLTDFFAPAPIVAMPVAAAPIATAPVATGPVASSTFHAVTPEQRVAAAVLLAPPATTPAQHATVAAPAAPSADAQKLRNEIRRLELLVKRLQAELEAGKEYCASLEAHVKTMQD
jgi:hypothetical protein